MPASGKKVEMIIPSEVRETEREVLYDIPSRCNLKMDTNEVLSQRDTELEKKLPVTKI